MAIRLTQNIAETFDRFFGREVERMKRPAKVAMEALQIGVVTDLRHEIAAAGLGPRLPNAVRGKTYPARDSFDPAAVVAVKDPRAVRVLDAFARGVTIKAKGVKWLAIPTEAAGPQAARPGRKRLDPKEWTRRTGIPLRFVPPGRGRRNALLVIDNARLTKRGRAALNQTRRKQADGSRVPYTRLTGRLTVIVFILVKTTRLKRRNLNPDAVAKRWVAQLPRLLELAGS